MQRSSLDSKEYQLHLYVVFGKYKDIFIYFFFILASPQEKLILVHVNNKGADQPAQVTCLIRVFVIPSLESIYT